MFSAPDSEHWEVEVGKQWEEGRVVGRGELLSENVENEEENEQAGKLFNTFHQIVSLLPISDVESGQQVVEAVGPHLLGVQHDDTQQITNNPKDAQTCQSLNDIAN